ncbi:hypothetical protein SKAU_G00092220 [Synaphobranchus kaupii]|uniref:Uncharacterized protein n=1 Tax=Synaphobranchus kaupii TaxID=118154 RepID=A0A9Q1FXH3_SYNKA|nr:hypothetical protein SKAU_G00092220 [Synaphobranchus kaupii]
MGNLWLPVNGCVRTDAAILQRHPSADAQSSETRLRRNGIGGVTSPPRGDPPFARLRAAEGDWNSETVPRSLRALGKCPSPPGHRPQTLPRS